MCADMKFTNLIAGYVKKVAMLFERAPNKKAEKAERASGEESLVANSILLLGCLFSNLCFSWSNTVYCIYCQVTCIENQNLCFDWIVLIDITANQHTKMLNNNWKKKKNEFMFRLKWVKPPNMCYPSKPKHQQFPRSLYYRVISSCKKHSSKVSHTMSHMFPNLD